MAIVFDRIAILLSEKRSDRFGNFFIVRNPNKTHSKMDFPGFVRRCTKLLFSVMIVLFFFFAEQTTLGTDLDDVLPRGAIQRFGSGRFHVKGMANRIEVSADGELIFVQGGSDLIVMDRESGRVIDDVRFQPGRGSIGKIASSSDKKLLAIAVTDFNAGPAESYRIVVINTQTRQRKVLRSKGRRSSVLFLKISSDHQFIVAGSDTDGLRFWNLETAEEISRPAITTQIIYAAAFSPDGKTLTAMGEDITLQWKWQTDEKPIQLTQHGQIRPSVLEYSPDGFWMLAGYHAADGLQVLHAANGESAWTLHINEKLINSVSHMAFTNDSRFVAVPMFANNRVDLWDLQSRRKVSSYPCWRPKTVAITPDGRWLIAAGEGSKVTVFDFATRRAVNIRSDGHDVISDSSKERQTGMTFDSRETVNASRRGTAVAISVGGMPVTENCSKTCRSNFPTSKLFRWKTKIPRLRRDSSLWMRVD
jgi:WD40 repeat protein